MNLSAKNFTATMDAKGLKYEVEEREGDVIISCGVSMENTPVRVRLFIDNDNSHVALRCFGFIRVTKEQFPSALLTCNKCNLDYRWVKFVIDDDLDINAYDDAVISPETAGEELFELLFRMLGIVDDCYPTFMKNIWA